MPLALKERFMGKGEKEGMGIEGLYRHTDPRIEVRLTDNASGQEGNQRHHGHGDNRISEIHCQIHRNMVFSRPGGCRAGRQTIHVRVGFPLFPQGGGVVFTGSPT